MISSKLITDLCNDIFISFEMGNPPEYHEYRSKKKKKKSCKPDISEAFLLLNISVNTNVNYQCVYGRIYTVLSSDVGPSCVT